MTQLFIHLFNVSVSAGFFIFAILIFRLVFKKAPKFISVLLFGLVGIRLVFGRAVQCFIEVGGCRLHIGGQPKESDSKGEYTENSPADEAEVEAEQLELVSVHHTAAFVDALSPSVLGVVVLDVEGHRIRVTLNYAENNEEK